MAEGWRLQHDAWVVQHTSLREAARAEKSDGDPGESDHDNLLTSDHDNRWESCDWIDAPSTGGLSSSIPDRRFVPAYL
jgi:hypothetical protein